MNLYLSVEKALAFNSLSGGGRTEPAQGVKFTGAKGATFTGGAKNYPKNPKRSCLDAPGVRICVEVCTICLRVQFIYNQLI